MIVAVISLFSLGFCGGTFKTITTLECECEVRDHKQLSITVTNFE